MRILILGGAGFIGSNLARYHVAKGDEVWVVDSLHTGRKENIASLALRFNQEDVCTWEGLARAIGWSDRIYHMAAAVGQRLVISQPAYTLSNNIRSCERVLQLLSNDGPHLLIASSSCVYCHSRTRQDELLCEDRSFILPSGKFIQESYQLSKIINEAMGLAYRFEKGVKCTIARLFNTVGKGQVSTYGMVIPTFIEQALKGVPLTVYGDGQQKRSFCNVLDVAPMLDLLMTNPKSEGQIVNVGDDHEVSILDLAKLVIKLTKSSSTIEMVSYKKAYGIDFVDELTRKPSLEKMRSLTNYRHKWTLESTIQSLIH